MPRGGARPGAGRPSKVDEEKRNELFARALKDFYKKDTDDEAKIALVKGLLDTQRGQIFVAEHVFGKPDEKVKVDSDGQLGLAFIVKKDND